jgi:Cu2+-exporting ATPase
MVSIALESPITEEVSNRIRIILAAFDGVSVLKAERGSSELRIGVKEAEQWVEIVRLLEEGGIRVRKESEVFEVVEMSCASCAVSVERILLAEAGVLSASVNFATSRVHVEYLFGVVSFATMQKAVVGGGFGLMQTSAIGMPSDAELERNRVYNELKRNTILSLLFSFPVFIIGMLFESIPYSNEIMWAMSSPVVLWFGRGFFRNAIRNLRRGRVNMDTLVATSTGTAYLFSVYNTLFPEFWLTRGLSVHVYFEAAAVIISFVLLGKLLEDRAKRSTSLSIKKLLGLQPDSVTQIHSDGRLEEISLSMVLPGMELLVKPGQKVAVDGRVIQGESYVDEGMLTGESVPVLKGEGALVYAGTLNQKGSFRYSAERVGSDTFLSSIIKMVESAQGSKAPVQHLVDRISSFFVPVVILVAFISMLIWNLSGVEHPFTQGLLSLITVLVIACPCALGLATPTAIMVGMGKAADRGILIKDAESLLSIRKVNVVVLDKTGTITQGSPKITESHWFDEGKHLPSVLYTIQRMSEHPIADAFVRHFSGISESVSTEFESITGFGVRARVGSELYFVGNRRFLEEQGLRFPEDKLLEYGFDRRSAVSEIWFFTQERVLGVFGVSDPIKPGSKEAIGALKALGVEVYMLTGDNERVADSVSKATGILQYRANQMPEDKWDFIKVLQKEGKVVAMVGDGINDSAALAQSDVSIAMGKGSDIAMEVARITIVNSDLMTIPEAFRLSAGTMRTVKQNLFWAFVYNVVGIPLAAGLLYPFNGFLLNPMLAGAAMAMSSVSVVLNSLRLKWARFWK